MVEETSDRLHQLPLLFPNLYENEDEMLHSRTVREIQIASNFAVLKSCAHPVVTETTSPSLNSNKRCKIDANLVHTTTTTSPINATTSINSKEQQQYQLAIETAILVQKEIEQWENSIRELELMLLKSQKRQHQQQNPTDDEEHQQTSNSEEISSIIGTLSSTSSTESGIVASGGSSNADKVEQVSIVAFPNAVSSSSSTTVSIIEEEIDDHVEERNKAVTPTNMASSVSVVTNRL